MRRFRLALLPLLCGALAHAAAAQPAPVPADVIYTDGVVWTGRAGGTVPGFAVRNGRVVAVGAPEVLAPWRGAGTRTESLGGAFVTPGFVDAHVHFLSGGFQLASVDLRDARTPAEFTARIAAFARTQPAGTWIVGGDWDHENWGGDLPTRAWIDAATPDHPVWVNRLDGHMALANSHALRLAGVDAAATAPEGGEIVRDAAGAPTGIFKDEAMGLVARAIPEPTPAQLDAALDRAQQHALALGVTQVHDMGSFGGWLDHAAYRRAHAANRLRMRVYSHVPVHTWRRLADTVAVRGRGDDRLRWGGLKGFVDGSLGSTTAWFYAPYDDEPTSTGLVVIDTTAFAAELDGADAAGLQIAVHAIGDRANDWILSVYARLAAARPTRERPFRVEHAQHLTPVAVARFGASGVVASMQPYHVIDDGRWAGKRIGDRVRTTYPFHTLLADGAPLAFGSDWTVAPMSVADGLYAALTRATLDGQRPGGWVPEEKIALADALDAYTRGGATAGGWEGLTGTLTPGKAADFVVWNANPFTLAPEALRTLRALRTVVDGETVYRAD